MPYPVVHVLFFVLFINAVAVYAILGSISRKKFSLDDSKQILLLLIIGSLFALFPDIMAVYNLLVNNSSEHCWIGPVPTHSFLFSSFALLCGTLTGLIAYRKFSKAIYLGLFAEAASLSHLLLDDAFEKGCEYIYPIYSGKISLFSLMDVGFHGNGLFNYLLKSFLSVFFFSLIMMIALFALSRLGFEFKYRSEK